MKDSLKLRLEHIKHLGNLKMELLKSFYDGRSIAERYINGEILLHVHGFASDYRFCATWRQGDGDSPCNSNEVPVFVWVGNLSEDARPIASIARLQLLDSCNMYIADTFETVLSPPIENLFAIIDGKLCFIYDLLGVKASQLIDQVIQGSSQIIDGFANENASKMRNWLHDIGCRTLDPINLMSIWKDNNCWLALNDNAITYHLAEGVDPLLQICQVYSCPSSPLISAIEWVHDMLYYHYGEESGKEAKDTKGIRVPIRTQEGI